MFFRTRFYLGLGVAIALTVGALMAAGSGHDARGAAPPAAAASD